MLLTIDAGNTNIVFAVFDGEKIQGQWRLSSGNRTVDEFSVSVSQFLQLGEIDKGQITDVIISSVVPQNIFPLKKMCQQYLGCKAHVVGEDGFKAPIEIKLKNPAEVGADRIVNAVAAFKKFGGDVIVIDFGTATTFDVVGGKGEYLGGAIAPGINLSIEALRKAAAKLPSVDVAKPKNVIGKSTVEAMQSGVYWGYVSLIEGITSRIKNEYGKKMTVVATGGLAPLFAKATNEIEHLEPDLTICGLKMIYDLVISD